MKIQQVRDIVTAYIVQGKTNAEVAKSVGVSDTTVMCVTKSVKNVRNGDWDALKHGIKTSKTIRRRLLEQLQEILNVSIPAELLEYADEMRALDTAKMREQYAIKRGGTVQPAEPEEKQTDMTGEFCMRVLTNQTAQTELMKAMLADLKTYGQAILSDMQRLAATQARMADGLNRMEAAIAKLDETLNDAGAALGADLKDNINANADVLRQELGAIKNNTRKRGL